MSILEGPKSRFTSFAATLADSAAAHSSLQLKPGCVQCGSLLDLSERKKKNFSGKCYGCENWVFDEEEFFDDFED